MSKIKIVETQIYGLCTDDGTDVLIELDTRQGQREFLNTAVHELLHAVFPVLEEQGVEHAANVIGSQLWKLGYRRKGK